MGVITRDIQYQILKYEYPFMEIECAECGEVFVVNHDTKKNLVINDLTYYTDYYPKCPTCGKVLINEN